MKKGIETEKLWTREFILVCLSNLFLFTGFYCYLPTLPLFTTEVFTGDKVQVGYIFGIFAFAAVITRPIVGYLLDRMQRKTIAWLSMACLFGAVIFYNWVTSLALLFILRFIHGICWGFATTSLATLVTDYIPIRKRGEGIGYYGLSISIAMFVGPVFGLETLLYVGYPALFYSGSALAVIALLCLLPLKHQKLLPIPNEEKKGFIETNVLSYGLIVFFLSLLYSGILSFIVLFAKELSIENSGMYFVVNALSLVISRPYAGKILDRKGPKKIMCVGFFALGATFLCLFFAQDYILFVLSALCLGIGFGIVHSTALTLAINKVDASRRGVVNGMILTAFDLGLGIGSLLLGALSNYAGLKIMYMTSGLMVFIPFGIFFMTHMRKIKMTEAEKLVA